MTPKRRLLTLIFACLCFKKSLLINNNNNNNNNDKTKYASPRNFHPSVVGIILISLCDSDTKSSVKIKRMTDSWVLLAVNSQNYVISYLLAHEW